jgi:hypothetical protein
MKAQILPAIVVIILFSVITGCGKIGCDPANMNGSMSLSGKWQLVQDSTANSMVRTVPLITNYVGVAGDYFDFRSDGFCYVKEGDAYDTLTYKQVSANSVIIQNFGIIINGSAEPSDLTRTVTTANITTQNMLTPGGTLFREVKLTR